MNRKSLAFLKRPDFAQCRTQNGPFLDTYSGTINLSLLQAIWHVVPLFKPSGATFALYSLFGLKQYKLLIFPCVKIY